MQFDKFEEELKSITKYTDPKYLSNNGVVNMNEEISKLIEEIESRLKEIKDTYRSKYLFGATYWYLDEIGEVSSDEWNNFSYEKEMFGIGNVFETRLEAEFEAEKRKVLHELKQLGRPFEPLSENWCIYINEHGQIDYYSEDESQYLYGDYYFNSKEEAIRAVEQIGEDRIHEYLFN